MFTILNLCTHYWVSDWKAKYSEIFNMAQEFFNKPENKYNKEILKFKKEDQNFTDIQKLVLFWMFSKGKKYGCARRIPLVAMSSTYIAEFMVPKTCDIPVVIQKIFIFKQLFGNQAELSKKINGVNFFVNEIMLEDDYVWFFWKNNISQTKFKPYTLEFEKRAQMLFFDIQKLKPNESIFFDFCWRLKLMNVKEVTIKDIQLEKANGILNCFKPPKKDDDQNTPEKQYTNFKKEKKEFLSKNNLYNN